ncbi:unnamed protein product [Arctogadus glacialis]
MRRDPLHCQAGRVMEGQEVKTTSAVRETVAPDHLFAQRACYPVQKPPSQEGMGLPPHAPVRVRREGGKRLDSGTPFTPEEVALLWGVGAQ